MPFGTDNLQYGTDLGGTTADWMGTGEGSVYDEYLQDTYVSDELDVSEYLYEYDPLKEQNLLADYMAGLTDLGDKTEEVRAKAIAERKALSKGIRGGLTSGTMVEMEKEGMEAASKAQASLYRGQAGAKRQLGEDISSLREAYEGDLAESVEAYNTNVGGGLTVGETAEATASGDLAFKQYVEEHGLAEGGTEAHGYGGFGIAGAKLNNAWGTNGDTYFDTTTGKQYVYYDKGFWYNGNWREGTYEDRYK